MDEKQLESILNSAVSVDRMGSFGAGIADAELMDSLGLSPDELLSQVGIDEQRSVGAAAVADSVDQMGADEALSMIVPHREVTPPSMVADGGTRDWSELQLIINQHSVHKVEVDEVSGDKMYVVSNLRKFTIEVHLIEKETNPPILAQNNQLRLRATLLYENGCPVKAASPDESLLLGETEVVVIQGSATFKLQMGSGVLSSKLGKQNFRIRIEPMDRTLREMYPRELIILTEPLKSVTKLERKPPPPGSIPQRGMGFDPNGCCSVVTQPPMPAPSNPTIPMPPPNATRQVSPPSMPGLRFAAPGACLFPPSPPRDEPPSVNGLSLNANGGPSTLAAPSFDNNSGAGELQDVVRQQKAQIAELTSCNAQILQELTRLRQAIGSGGQ